MTLERQLNDPNFALFSESGVTVMGLDRVIDLNPDVDHNQSVSVTAYPIESGGSLTDNAVVEPNKLTIRSYVSDLLISENTALNISPSARAAAAWGVITELMNRREPLTVTTRIQVYNNMLITNLSSSQNEDTGGALVFTIRLEEVLFSQTQLVRLPPVIVGDGPAQNKTSTVDRGDQQARTPTLEEQATINRNLIGDSPL